MKYYRYTMYICTDSAGLTAYRTYTGAYYHFSDSVEPSRITSWDGFTSCNDNIETIYVCCNESGGEIHKIFDNIDDAEEYAAECNESSSYSAFDQGEPVMVECLRINER